MEYNKELTLMHPLASFARNLNELIKKDGGKGLFPNEYMALSIDEAELARNPSNRDKTMDSAIGTIRKGTSANPRNKKILMCEFRFNYKNPQSISKTDLENKIRHTRLLLQEDYTGSIHDKCYFLFSEKVIAVARSYFERMYISKVENRVVVTEAEMVELLR